VTTPAVYTSSSMVWNPPPSTTTTMTYSQPTYTTPTYVETFPILTFDTNRRYILKAKSWVFGGDMYIKDQDDEEIFRVKGRLLTIGADLLILDLRKNPLIEIRQSVWMPKMPQFEIVRGHKECLAVKKRNKSKQSPEAFSIDSINDGSRLRIVGDWPSYEYEIHRGTGAHAYPIAKVSRRFWKLTDCYSVEIAAREDILVILALCIIIDRIIHENW